MRRRSVLVLAVAAVLVQACDGSTAPQPRRSTVQCIDTLSIDSVVTRTLDSANACRSRDLLTGDSTLGRAFALRVEAGRGYLVTMQSKGVLRTRLELIGGAGDSSAGTLLAASRNDVSRAQLLFAATAAATDTVRATTADALPIDTGSYDISVRTCRVPIAVTDSISHSDTNVGGDCLVSLSSFLAGDNDVAYVQLYAVRSTDGTKVRPISFQSSTPMRVFFGGPHLDTFGVVGGSELGYLDSAATSGSFYFSGRPGDYTLVMASNPSAGTTLSYTLTIGGERTLTSAKPTRTP